MEIRDLVTGLVEDVNLIQVRDRLNPGEYEVYATSSTEDDEGVHLYALVTTLEWYPLLTNPNYPESISMFTLTISRPSCDCGLITWDYPAIKTFTTGVLVSPIDTFEFEKAT